MPTYTFLDMQNRIIDELINESITVAQIKREIYSTNALLDLQHDSR